MLLQWHFTMCNDIKSKYFSKALWAGPDLSDARHQAIPLVRPLSHCYEEKIESVAKIRK